MVKYQGNRLRKGRYSEPNTLYLLTTVTANREPLFSNFQLGRIVIRSMRHHHDAGYINSLAFVVMPDHVHWLVQLNDRYTLPALMRSFKGYTSKQVNEFYKKTGRRIWQPGYHDHALREEEDIKQIARYIVANPLRAGLVEHIGDYPLWDAIWL